MAAKTVTAPAGQEPAPKGGTYPLSQIAEVRMRGGDIPAPGSEAEELILAAWEAYRYIRALAQRTGKEMRKHDRDGWVASIQIQDVFHSVWPAGASPLPKAGTEHDEARRMLTTWLNLHQNLTLVDRGNPDIRSRGAVLASRASTWWVAAEFSGVPEGMRLPETSVVTGEVLVKPEAAKAEAPAPGGRDWWCPYDGQCGLGAPQTEQDLERHFIERHGARKSSFLLAQFMEDASRLHGTPFSEPEPEAPGVLTSLVPAAAPAPEARISAATEFTACPPPAPAPARTRTRTLASPADQQGGKVSAQARVFAMHVAELEDEVARLRADNADLRRRLADKYDQPVNVTVSAASLDLLARRVANLVKSENEHS